MFAVRSLALLLIGGCAANSGSPEADFRERLLAILPESARLNLPISFSDDGRRAAYIDQDGASSRAVAGEWRSRAFERLC
jgi:hypothetical protein